MSESFIHASSTQLNLNCFSVLTNMQHFSIINQPSFYIFLTRTFYYCHSYFRWCSHHAHLKLKGDIGSEVKNNTYYGFKSPISYLFFKHRFSHYFLESFFKWITCCPSSLLNSIMHPDLTPLENFNNFSTWKFFRSSWNFIKSTSKTKICQTNPNWGWTC